MKLQGSPHTGREWSAPTTTQPFLPPLRIVYHHSQSVKSAEMLYLMRFDNTLAKVQPPLRYSWGEL